MVRSDQSVEGFPRGTASRSDPGRSGAVAMLATAPDLGRFLFAAQALSPSHSLGPISDVPHHAVSFNRTRRGRVPPDWRGCVGERDPRTACPRTGGLLALCVRRRPCASA